MPAHPTNNEHNMFHRKNIRLQNYDYQQAGAYFVTICTQGRECLFGDVIDKSMVLNDAGYMIQQIWNQLSVFYNGVQTDEFIVMPNHIHGIVVLLGTGSSDPSKLSLSLGDVVHRFKSLTTKRYSDDVKLGKYRAFLGRLWQRNYYEHIIRNEESLNHIRQYIIDNPTQWEEDRENPLTKSKETNDD